MIVERGIGFFFFLGGAVYNSTTGVQVLFLLGDTMQITVNN